MENASKAIIIAGGFLIGVLLISLGMYMLSFFREYYSDTEKLLRLNEIMQYNSFFEAYPNESHVSGDVAYSFWKKCEDIKNDPDSDFSTSCTIGGLPDGDPKKVFYFTEPFSWTYEYKIDAKNSEGVITNISFTKISE